MLSALAVGVATPIVATLVQPHANDTDPLLFVAQAAPNVGDCSVTTEWITGNAATEPDYEYGPEAVPADGVLATGGWLGIAVQATPGKTVILESVSVQTVSRRPPVAGDLLDHSSGCGELAPRYFKLDLDASNPTLTPHTGGASGQIPAATFPFTVGEQDPEMLLIQLDTHLYSSSFRLELHWVSDGRAGTTTVDDHGQPFVVSSVSRAMVYCPDPTSGAWQPSRSASCQ